MAFRYSNNNTAAWLLHGDSETTNSGLTLVLSPMQPVGLQPPSLAVTVVSYSGAATVTVASVLASATAATAEEDGPAHAAKRPA